MIDHPKVLHVLLSGIVGSTAYGLARPGSDIDRLGIFAVPTEQLHGLHAPTQSHVTNTPDRTLHEAAKWCRLALGGNPTVMELVWLPPDLYEIRTPLGDELIGIRTSFLSAKRVRDAYLGYATQQFRRLEARGDGSFSADTRKRTAKHARHLKRLCHQGLELYTTGRLTIRVEDPQSFHDFGEQVAADSNAARPLLAEYETAFDERRSALPAQPDGAAVEAWLHRVRAHFYDHALRHPASPEAADVAASLRQFERTTGPRAAAQISENVGILRVVDELRRLAGETQQDRCPSCDHKAEYHDVDNRCWFTVDHGVAGSNLGCPCAPRRDTDEAQQDPAPGGETEAHPAEHTWAAELYDPTADEWVPGTRYITRDRAVNHLNHARGIGPVWKDGTPTQRRLVRATTTYTVEDPTAPTRSGQPDTNQEVPPVHACPGPDDNGISRCCGRRPFDFRGEHLTRDPDKVTCKGVQA